MLGLRVDGPAFTWPQETYLAPRGANHETDGNSRWYLAFILAGEVCLAVKKERQSVVIHVTAGIGVVLFSGYLKWQLFMLGM